jgi:integrase
MVRVRKRGKCFHADLLMRSSRYRGSLGTRNQDAARRFAHRLDLALSEGPASTIWPELNDVLPRTTYLKFANLVGAKDRQVPTWNDLHESFKIWMEQRVKIGKLESSTERRYKITLREFEYFLNERRISFLHEITKSVMESFKVWRVTRIRKRKFARGATSLSLDLAILHRAFGFALENETIVKNPVRMEGRPGENPQNGADPFRPRDLVSLREHAGEDLLSVLLLRWTGLRGSDAVSLTWKEVYFDRKEIERITQKRKKRVVLPIASELMFALELAHEVRKPQASDRVLINPATGNPLTRPRLYHRMLALGKRAGVPAAHPHRFRDTLAVDMLCRGATPYDVAKMLGDRIETVEKHYTPFVPELRERVRSILENRMGLEDSVTPASQSAHLN